MGVYKNTDGSVSQGVVLETLGAAASTINPIPVKLAADVTIDIGTVDQGAAGASPWLVSDVATEAGVGAPADAAWVSGSGSIVAIMKNVAAALAGNLKAVLQTGSNVVGYFRQDAPIVATGTLTRPANTTPYAAGQIVSAAANGQTTTPFSFTLAAVNGDGGFVINARLVKSTTSLTAAAFRLFFFDSAAPTLTSLGDQNSYASPKIADYAAYVGYMDFNAGVAGTDNASFEGVPSQQLLAFLCAGGSKVVYGVLTCTGAYTPGNAEVFDVRVVSEPN